jgi:hypothetical protein
MALLDIPLDSISEDDLSRLIATGARETIHLDFKQSTYGAKENDHVEFLADVSSFANTAGGDIVIGMAEANGVPARVVPFMGDVDQEVTRLEEMARLGLEPRIQNLRARPISLAGGGHVIVIRAPKSLILPHRVLYKNRNRFWARSSSQRYEPSVAELRRMFIEANQYTDRVRSFVRDRIKTLFTSETPIGIISGPKVAVHVIPIPSFVDGRFLDLIQTLDRGTFLPMPLAEVGLRATSFPNLDGFCSASQTSSGYVQFFRSGAIEALRRLGTRDDGCPYFVGHQFANMLLQGVRQYRETLMSYDAGFPISIFVSLLDVQNCYHKRVGPFGEWVHDGPLGRQFVILPDVQVTDAQTDVLSAMRPLFNVLWNAFGSMNCDLYDQHGKWIGAA